MSSYKESQWAIFRKGVIELDGHKCTNCGRGEDEVVLQVHHKKYVTGLKAWEYPTADCITLCKGCHAEEHGKIQPQYDWECIGKEDLGDLIGTCDNCGSSMRYSFTVFHPQRGTVNVGITCCNNLTDSKIATSFKESRLKFESRKKSFITSTRWKLVGGVYKIKQGLFNIEIRESNQGFSLKIEDRTSKIVHNSLEEAKAIVFDNIENGELVKFFIEKGYNFESSKKTKQKKL